MMTFDSIRIYSGIPLRYGNSTGPGFVDDDGTVRLSDQHPGDRLHTLIEAHQRTVRCSTGRVVPYKEAMDVVMSDPANEAVVRAYMES